MAKSEIYSQDRAEIYREEYRKMKRTGSTVRMTARAEDGRTRIEVSGQDAFKLHRRVATRLQQHTEGDLESVMQAENTAIISEGKGRRKIVRL